MTKKLKVFQDQMWHAFGRAKNGKDPSDKLQKMLEPYEQGMVIISEGMKDYQDKTLKLEQQVHELEVGMQIDPNAFMPFKEGQDALEKLKDNQKEVQVAMSRIFKLERDFATHKV